jgi:hypothetical protein
MKNNMTKEEILIKLNEAKFETHKVVIVKRLPPKVIEITDTGLEIPGFQDEQEEVIEVYNNEELVDYLFNGKIKLCTHK